MSVDDADASGFPLKAALASTFGAAQNLEWDVRVVPPRSFFEQRGLKYPAFDPTTPARITLSPSGRATVFTADQATTPGGADCTAHANVDLNVEITFLDFDETQTGSGYVQVDASGPVWFSLSLGELGDDCGLMHPSAPTDPAELYCNSRFDPSRPSTDGLVGTNQCAAPATWPAVPPEPTTGLSWAQFFERPEVRQPVQLSCRQHDGTTAPLLTASISLEVASNECPVFFTQAAASVQLSSVGNFDNLGATVGYKVGLCSNDPLVVNPGEPEPVAPKCPGFVVEVETPTANQVLHLWLVIHDDGSQTLHVRYFDPEYAYAGDPPAVIPPGNAYGDCSGELEIPSPGK